MDPQLTSFVIPETEVEQIEVCLNSIQAELNATCIALLDQSGQVIAAKSMQHKGDLMAIGALISGNFYSSRELARVLNEPEFTTLFQQGPRESIHAELVLEKWILAIIFRKQTLLGLVRVVSKRAVGELEVILQRVKATAHTRPQVFTESMFGSFSETIDLLFKD